MLQPDDKRLKLCGLNCQGDLGPITFYTSSRNKLVAFAKAPPLSPPSRVQLHMRNFFRLVATAWRQLSTQARAAWEAAARGAKTRTTGYNLYLWFQRYRDQATLNTIARAANMESPTNA